MKNYVQEGDVVPFVAPADVVAGTPVLIDGLFIIPAFSAANGYDCEGVTKGVFTLAKKSADTPTQFQKAYWDDTNKEVTVTPTANNLIGVFMEAVAGGVTEAAVRLDGTAV